MQTFTHGLSTDLITSYCLVRPRAFHQASQQSLSDIAASIYAVPLSQYRENFPGCDSLKSCINEWGASVNADEEEKEKKITEGGKFRREKKVRK